MPDILRHTDTSTAMTTRTTLYLLLACVAAHAAPIHEMPSSNRSFKRNNDDDEGVAWKDMTPAQRGGWIAGFTIFGVFFVVVLTAMLVGWVSLLSDITVEHVRLTALLSTTSTAPTPSTERCCVTTVVRQRGGGTAVLGRSVGQ